MAEPRKPSPHADNDDEAGFPPHPGKDDSAEPDSSEGKYEDDFHEDGGGD